METGKIFLIMNPSSKSGRGKKLWPSIFSRLEESSIPFSYQFTEKQFDGQILASKAINQGFDKVVAVGGDGTINEVITGFMETKSKGDQSQLGVIYTGTSPDFCRFHHIPLQVEKAVDTVIIGHSRKVDIAKITHCLNEGQSKQQVEYFGCSANLGVGAAVARGSNSGLRKYLGDTLGTLISVLISVLKYRKNDFNITIDGKPHIFKQVVNLTVGKNPYLASGLKLLPQFDCDNGKLFIYSICHISFIKLLFYIRYLYRGDFYRSGFVEVKEGKVMEIQANPINPEVEFDGDPRGFLPAKIEVIPQALPLLVDSKNTIKMKG